MKKGLLFFVTLFILINSSIKINAQYSIPPKMQWWYEARFGMFIHFGSYSYLERGEWAFSVENWSKFDYQTKCSSHFNPINFNASEIVSLAKNAGMKYIVITAKHHEGFAMWKTNVLSFKDTTGTMLYDLYHYANFKRDILAELKAECDKQGIKFCLYYSILDWNHPSQRISKGDIVFSTIASLKAKADYIVDMKAQLKELINNYNPAALWFDGDWCLNTDSTNLSQWWTAKDGIDLYNYLVTVNPKLIINERVKREHGLGDYECPEQTVPNKPLKRPWETCTTLNGAWGFDASKENSYKSSDSLIIEMVKVISRNGNYLLNIGPRADGNVPEKAKLILNDFGKWMKPNCESVIGTTGSPFESEPSWGFYTKKGNNLYLHIIKWPNERSIQIPLLKGSIKQISLLKNHELLKYSTINNSIIISIPEKPIDNIDSVIEIDFEK